MMILPLLAPLSRIGLVRHSNLSHARPLIRSFHRCLIALDKPHQKQRPLVPQTDNRSVQTPQKVDRATLEAIPGQRPLVNDVNERIPKFPFGRENMPTLLPRPGVPRVGVDGMTFGKMINILKNKKEPELIYDAEPHRLYFIICGCFALVFAFYAWNIGLISFPLAFKIFQDNNLELPVMHQYINFALQFIISCVLVAMPLAVMTVFIMAPTRLIRRMWYIPGEVEHVQFITHPLLPSSASPIYTIELRNLRRAHNGKVWTGRGFYGTIDSTIFFFLREANNRVPWIVDRKGFFWGDGRVYDYLFGKESIEEAELGITLNEKAEIASERVKRGEETLKKELGTGWRLKAQGRLMKEDIKSLKDIVAPSLKAGSSKAKLPPSDSSPRAAPPAHKSKK